MLKFYGVNEKYTGTGVDGKSYNATLDPIYLLRSGSVVPFYDYVYGDNNYAGYWASEVYYIDYSDSLAGYMLDVYRDDVGFNAATSAGRAIRCVADWE